MLTLRFTTGARSGPVSSDVRSEGVKRRLFNAFPDTLFSGTAHGDPFLGFPRDFRVFRVSPFSLFFEENGKTSDFSGRDAF